MAILKSQRKESQFEVFHHLYKMRRDITDLLLRDFGFDIDRARRNALKRFGKKNYEELNDEDKERYDKSIGKQLAFDKWFIEDERKAIVDCLRNITEEVFVANNIFPTYMEELIERRLHQDRAIGQCYRLEQELQYAIDTLPVDVNKYLRFGDMIDREIKLIKSWRKSDNKFKRAFSDSASNFANVNSNGNANNNSASNSNGVRPDFDSTIK